MTIYVCFDPGESTGYAVFDDQKPPRLLDWGVLRTLSSVWWFMHKFMSNDPHIVYETFRLYGHRAQAQINSEFFTVQVIGVINLFVQEYQIPVTAQNAQTGKAIWSLDKLKRFNYWVSNQHARSAIMHGLTALEVHRIPTIRNNWKDPR